MTFQRQFGRRKALLAGWSSLIALTIAIPAAAQTPAGVG